MIHLWKGYLGRWVDICEESINLKIFRSILTIGSVHFLVSFVAVGKDLFIANQFGTGDEMDAFLIANLLPTLVINIVTGAFHVAFIPEFIKVRKQQGRAAASALLSNILAWYLLLLLSLCVVMVFFSSVILPLLGTSFNSEKLFLSRNLFLFFVPTVIFYGVIKACGSILNAGEHFFLPSFSPVIIPLLSMLALLGFGGHFGIYALAAGILAGIILEAIVLVSGLRSQGYLFLPRLGKMSEATKNIIQQFSPMILGLLLVSGTAFVDQAMAATIGPGSVSTLNYGSKVVQFILGLSTVSLSTAIFPHFSKMVAEGSWRNIINTLKMYSALILLVTIPVTTVLFIYSEPLIRLVFERGAFLPKDTVVVGKVQGLYLLQIPFYILGILFVRMLSALKKNHVLMTIGGLNFTANIIGNYIFMQYWGVAGIGLSTSIVYVISTLLSFLALYQQLKARESMAGEVNV